MADQYREAAMKQLPFSNPGRPDTRSPTRLLLWIGRQQLGTLALGMTFGVIWMLAQALLPYALGRAVDDGLAAGDNSALLVWAGVLLALGTVQAVAGVLRHRAAVSNWLQASFRMVQVVAHHAARSGPAVRAKLTTGTWLGARLAVQGRISPGELVAFYGYAAFLVIPLRTAAGAGPS